jgi:hypothetical protein
VVTGWGFPELGTEAATLAAEMVAGCVSRATLSYRGLQEVHLIVLIVRWQNNTIFIETTSDGPDDTLISRQLVITAA